MTSNSSEACPPSATRVVIAAALPLRRQPRLSVEARAAIFVRSLRRSAPPHDTCVFVLTPRGHTSSSAKWAADLAVQLHPLPSPGDVTAAELYAAALRLVRQLAATLPRQGHTQVVFSLAPERTLFQGDPFSLLLRRGAEQRSHGLLHVVADCEPQCIAKHMPVLRKIRSHPWTSQRIRRLYGAQTLSEVAGQPATADEFVGGDVEGLAVYFEEVLRALKVAAITTVPACGALGSDATSAREEPPEPHARAAAAHTLVVARLLARQQRYGGVDNRAGDTHPVIVRSMTCGMNGGGLWIPRFVGGTAAHTHGLPIEVGGELGNPSVRLAVAAAAARCGRTAPTAGVRPPFAVVVGFPDSPTTRWHVRHSYRDALSTAALDELLAVRHFTVGALSWSDEAAALDVGGVWSFEMGEDTDALACDFCAWWVGQPDRLGGRAPAGESFAMCTKGFQKRIARNIQVAMQLSLPFGAADKAPIAPNMQSVTECQAYSAVQDVNMHVERMTLLKSRGFYPSAVLDIGAHHGEWRDQAQAVWPGTMILSIEANPGNDAELRTVLQPFEYTIALLGSPAQAGELVSFFVPRSFSNTGASMYPTAADVLAAQSRNPSRPHSNIADHDEIKLPVRTLDETIARHFGRWFAVGEAEAPTFQLIKLDIQGAELDALSGAFQTLRSAAFVLLEISTRPAGWVENLGAPSFAQVIRFMADRGFDVIDVFELHFGERPEAPNHCAPRGLTQIDLLFQRSDLGARYLDLA